MKSRFFSVLALCAAVVAVSGAVAAEDTDSGDSSKADPAKAESKPSSESSRSHATHADASKAEGRAESGKADSKKTKTESSKGDSSKADSKADPSDPKRPERLDIPRMGPAFYLRPAGGHGLKPVLVYLHGRGGNPEADCAKWAPVARDFGWILCPSGPEDRGGGSRAWANNWIAAKNVVDSSLAALRDKFGRRVQLRGNTLIGFSEGAFVAMNLGVREPEGYHRWLILAANDGYWGGEGQDELVKQYARIKRVYLLTGEQDGVVDNTRRVFDILDQA